MGNRIEGTGFGLGIKTNLALASFGLIFRAINYDEWNADGTSINLPNTQFDDSFKFYEVALEVGIAVDLL